MIGQCGKNSAPLIGQGGTIDSISTKSDPASKPTSDSFMCGITVDPYYPGQPPLDGWPRWAHHPFLTKKKKNTLRT